MIGILLTASFLRFHQIAQPFIDAWVFPPAETWASFNWSDGISDERDAIRLLEDLRNNGAEWFPDVRTRQRNTRLDDLANSPEMTGRVAAAKSSGPKGSDCFT